MSTLVFPPDTPDVHRLARALGRALIIATSFEFDCRCLALCLRLRDPSLDQMSSAVFERFVSEPAIAKLAKNLDVVTQGLDLGESYRQLLSDAREARNFIAHEAAENIDQLVAGGDALVRWREALELKLRELALGKVVLSLLLPRVSAVQAPARDDVHEYSDRLAAWVLDDT